ncbi:MAG: hypothetical protein H6564_01530 [Lewinellaceae bacterium]|nr:hypothetical protein [Lewinellaceae bacterium]
MQQTDKDTKQFFIGLIADEQYRELALSVLPELEGRLNAAIDLKAFSTEIERLYLTVIVSSEPEAEGEYKLKGNKLFLNVVISGEPVEQLNKQRFLSLVGQGVVGLLGRVEGVPEGVVEGVRGAVDRPNS